MGLFSFTQELAMDLGTANTIITCNDKMVVDEPSVIALDARSEKVLAVGRQAREMYEKTNPNIRTIRPLREGVIADFYAAEQMMRGLIKMASGRKRWFAPSLRMVIGIPSGSTEVEIRAVRDSAEHAGGREVYMVFEPMAAAIGAGLPVSEAAGSLVIDIGGGTTEVGVISLGGMVYSGSVRVGGDKFDQAIVSYVRRNFGMLIGEPTAELIKMEIGSAFPSSEAKEIEVKGRNLSEGVPRTFTIHSNEVLEALTEPLNQIVGAVKTALEKTPPELGADIAERGMMLTGGGALLRDLDQLLQEQTGLPVHIAEEPLNCVVKGCGIALENIDRLHTAFTYG